MDVPALTAATRFDLDHLAIATPDADRVLDTLSDRLGAAVLFSERAPGFRYAMARIGTPEDGMNLEVLEPADPGDDPFLERFLHDHGPGPHHITFQTADLRERLPAVLEAGISPVRVSLDWSHWQEAFVLPREGHGTVLQLAGSDIQYPPTAEMEACASQGREPVVPRLRNGSERGWARQRPGKDHRVRMREIVLGTPDLPAATRLFSELLDGVITGNDEPGTTIAWPGGRIRLVERDIAGVVAVRVTGPMGADAVLSGLRLEPADGDAPPRGLRGAD